MNTDNLNNVPGAIIDSGSCSSVVGRETLDETMRQLSIHELKDEHIFQREHRFGSSNEPMRTIRAVQVPIVYLMQVGDQRLKFDV